MTSVDGAKHSVVVFTLENTSWNRNLLKYSASIFQRAEQKNIPDQTRETLLPTLLLP